MNNFVLFAGESLVELSPQRAMCVLHCETKRWFDVYATNTENTFHLSIVSQSERSLTWRIDENLLDVSKLLCLCNQIAK